MVNSGLPAGGDIGTEALGFFPRAAATYPTAYVASALGATIGQGANSVLSIGPNGLRQAALQPGDLLAASETAGTTVRVRCARKCSVRRVADGPAAAHVEGHIVFAFRASQALAPSVSTASWAVSVGLRPTLTPFASSASFFASAVPEEPEMIAPAWPICFPGGAVKPAM